MSVYRTRLMREQTFISGHHPGGLPRLVYELAVRAELEAHGFTSQHYAALHEAFIWESYGPKAREARDEMAPSSIGKRLKKRTKVLRWGLWSRASVTCWLFFNGRRWGVQMERWWRLSRARRHQEHVWLGSSASLRAALRLAVEGVLMETELNRKLYGARWEMERELEVVNESVDRLGGRTRKPPVFALAGRRFPTLREAFESHGITDIRPYVAPVALPSVPGKRDRPGQGRSR
jgi:hypothetical protein